VRIGSHLDRPLYVEPLGLVFRQYDPHSPGVSSFDCGYPALNEFIRGTEASDLQRELLGFTTLVYLGDELVAYYTLYNTLVRIGSLKEFMERGDLGRYRVEGIPGTAIGRLAVSRLDQSRGIGRIILMKIATESLHNPLRSAARMVIVQAKESAMGFYRRMGYEFASETRNELKRLRNTGTRTMFFDLAAIRGSG